MHAEEMGAVQTGTERPFAVAVLRATVPSAPNVVSRVHEVLAFFTFEAQFSEGRSHYEAPPSIHAPDLNY